MAITKHVTRPPGMYEDLLGLLRNPNLLPALASVDTGCITPNDREALRNVYEHFCPSQSTNGEHEHTERDTEQVEAAHKRKRSAASPMRRLAKLSSPSLTLSVEQMIDTGDIERFFNAEISLFDGIRETQIGETLGDVFRSRCRYVSDLEGRAGRDNARWCFAMLMFFDLVKLIKPNATGSRMGELMRRDAVPFLEEVFDRNRAMISEAQVKLERWSRTGKKLNQLCHEFGPGSLFFLSEHLSRDFMEFKYAETGCYHEQVFEHLRRLGLVEQAVRTGANTFVRRIREYLGQTFRDFLAP